MSLRWSDVREALAPWTSLSVAFLGGAAVALGVFDPGYPILSFTLSIAAALLTLIGLDLRRRWRARAQLRPPLRGFFIELEGPALWLVGLWTLTRIEPSYGPHLTPALAAALVALRLKAPRTVWLPATSLALLMELGLALSGRQAWLIFGLRVVLMGGLMEAGRWLHAASPEARQAPKAPQPEIRWTERLNLLTVQNPSVPSWNSNEREPQAQSMRLSESFGLQLDVLRLALGLSTAVVLWRDNGRLRVFSHATDRGPLKEGPYPEDSSVLREVLGEARIFSEAPIKRPQLPYYKRQRDVGGVFAVAIQTAGVTSGVLCVDRASEAPWTDAERDALDLTARKLSADLAFTRRFKATKHELTIIERFSRGLQKLNQTLELREAAEAALEAVQLLVQIDLAVISLLEGPDPDFHKVLLAIGHDAERFKDLTFTADEGLVGRAVASKQTLPAPGAREAHRAIFTQSDRLPRMGALLIVPLLDADGEAIGALTVASVAPNTCDQPPHRDMLELIAAQVAVRIDLARAHERIKEMATVDGLTGLLNHRTFQQAFDKMLMRAQRNERPLSVILTDIDHFKRFNDTYGHPFGDVVLKRVAQVLGQAVRNIDVAARYGGEEFVLLLEDSDAEGARIRAEHIRREVEALVFEHETGAVGVTLSLGISSFPEDAELKPDLIDRADKALYHAKHSGRNQVCCWTDLPPEARPIEEGGEVDLSEMDTSVSLHSIQGTIEG